MSSRIWWHDIISQNQIFLRNLYFTVLIFPLVTHTYIKSLISLNIYFLISCQYHKPEIIFDLFSFASVLKKNNNWWRGGHLILIFQFCLHFFSSRPHCCWGLFLIVSPWITAATSEVIMTAQDHLLSASIWLLRCFF